MVQSRVVWEQNATKIHHVPCVDGLGISGEQRGKLKAFERLEKVREIDLSYKGMDIIGTELSTLDALTSLYKLDLSHSELHKLPEAIGFLRSLTHLFLNDNYLSSLQPKIIRPLENLQELDLRNNKLNDLSLDITELIYLRRLSVQGNPLKDDETRKLMMLAHNKTWIGIDIAGECQILL